MLDAVGNRGRLLPLDGLGVGRPGRARGRAEGGNLKERMRGEKGDESLADGAWITRGRRGGGRREERDDEERDKVERVEDNGGTNVEKRGDDERVTREFSVESRQLEQTYGLMSWSKPTYR